MSALTPDSEEILEKKGAPPPEWEKKEKVPDLLKPEPQGSYSGPTETPPLLFSYHASDLLVYE